MPTIRSVIDRLRSVRPSSGPVLGVAVRSGQLRLTIGTNRSLVWYRVVPLNPAYLEGGVIAQPRAVATALRNALAQAPYPEIRDGIAALPGYHALSAVLDIPRSRDFKPEEILPREARRLFSYRQDSSVLSWWPLNAPGLAGRRYLLVVARRAAMQALREVFSMAELRLKAIDSGPLAATRAANIGEGVVVVAESDGGDVVVVKSGNVGMVRSVYWGGDIVDQESLLARVTDMVERTVAEHNNANPMGPLNVQAPLVLTGAGADLLGDSLATSLGRPTAPLEPPLALTAEMPIGEIGVNIGLALR